MIIDAHCHAWRKWPYRPPVPDENSRGVLEQLLHEMDKHGVDKAVVICANIEKNPRNNSYVAKRALAYPGRIYPFADVDSCWSPTHHTPGSGALLTRAARTWSLKGVTHYLSRDDDGSWLRSAEGLKFFAAAAERGLIVSLSCYPHQLPAVRSAAERFPAVPVLLHHLGHVQANHADTHGQLKEVLACVALSNIYVKISGFAYASDVKWDFPFASACEIVRAIYEHFGPQRCCWGSDYPVVRKFMTYQQSLEIIRSHCAFISEADKSWILGRTIRTLLEEE